MILEQVGEDIWVVDGPEILFLGLTLGTRMTVVRLGEELWVHSPVSITNEMEAEIERLGKVRYIVAPNRYHHIFLPEWRSKFPEAGIFAAPGLTEKRPDIAFDGELTNTGQYNWSGTLPHAIFGRISRVGGCHSNCIDLCWSTPHQKQCLVAFPLVPVRQISPLLETLTSIREGKYGGICLEQRCSGPSPDVRFLPPSR